MASEGSQTSSRSGDAVSDQGSERGVAGGRSLVGPGGGLALLIELASYRFEPPIGFTHAEVLLAAHRIRVARDDYNIAPIHLADAIEQLVAGSRESLSQDRAAKDPYVQARPSTVDVPDE